MHFQSQDLRAGIQRLLDRFIPNTADHEDLLQAAIIETWDLESRRTGDTLSWHVQHCKFLIIDHLRRGRSIDSPKRSSLAAPLEPPDEASDCDPRLISRDEVLSQVSARDIMLVLLPYLSPSERTVLELLLEGFLHNEIAQQLHVHPSTVSRRRSRIAVVAEGLGITR